MKPTDQDFGRHLEQLSRAIGPRPNGSPGNHAASRYIQSVLEDNGLAVEIQEYACPEWEELETVLVLDGETLEAAANPFSPSCEVHAPLVAACTLAELEDADLEGRIAVLYGDLTLAPLSAKSWFLKTDRDDRMITLLEAKKPAAIVMVQTAPGWLNRLIEDWEFTLPSATVPAQAGLALLRRLGESASLRIHSRQAPGTTCNVVARIPGSSPGRIVVCAHYDTKYDTPGACDNASGVAVVLGLAQRFSPGGLNYTLELVAFTGEEYLPIGDDEYMRRNGDFSDIVAAINFDLVGQALGATSLAIFSSSDDFQQQVDEIKRRYPGIAWVDPWPQSNHSTFAMRGVPSLAFGSSGGLANYHLRSDTMEWAGAKKLAEAEALAADIITSLQDRPPGRSPLGARKRYDLDKIQHACDEVGFMTSRTRDSVFDVVEIDLGSGAVLRFQNSEREQDCLVGFLDAPWHGHDDFMFYDPRGYHIEMDYLDVVSGLAEGTVLICEIHTNGSLVDRRLIHKHYSDEFDYMEEEDQIIVRRAKKRKVGSSSESG